MRSRLNAALKSTLKSALWASGTLAGYHRLRNRHVLTVAAFHRVLDPADPRAAGADPLWTVSTAVFAQCLEFFQDHYQVVSLAEVLAAREGTRPLPPWPLLITFDDGWADNRDYALPELQQRRLPAALFVATGALGRREGFWQERILAAWQSGRIAPAQARALWQRLLPGPAPADPLAAGRRIVAALAGQPAAERQALLQDLPPAAPGEPAAMLDDPGLAELARSGVAIGTHGVSHEPLTAVADPAAELRASWQDLGRRLDGMLPAPTLSFPHGRYGRPLLTLARRLGYRLMFTSERGLNRIEGHRLPDVLGRIEITTERCGAGDGWFRPEILALWLFRQPHLCLSESLADPER